MIDSTIPTLELPGLEPARTPETERLAAQKAVSGALDICIARGYKADNKELLVVARVCCGGAVPDAALRACIRLWAANAAGEPAPIKQQKGRPRQHADAAEKQKAYRARQKAKGKREAKIWTRDVRDKSVPLRSDIIDLSAIHAKV